jgi:hypothetical protein
MGRKTCTEPQCLYEGALYFYLMCNLYLKHQNKLISGLCDFELHCLLSHEKPTPEFCQTVLNLHCIWICSVSYHHITCHVYCGVMICHTVHVQLLKYSNLFCTTNPQKFSTVYIVNCPSRALFSMTDFYKYFQTNSHFSVDLYLNHPF